MPAPQRRHHTAVIPALLDEPQRFEFFQAVRLLDRWLASAEAGRGLRRVQFRNSISLAFPSSEIESLTVRGRTDLEDVDRTSGRDASEIDAVELTPSCMGLLGVSGALPLFYTEAIAQRELMHRDPSARAFLDIFSHRAVSMFYEAWRKHRLPIQFEHDRRDRYLPIVLALSGLGQRGIREQLRSLLGGVRDESLAFFSGAIQQRTWSVHQMQSVLTQYFGVPVRMEQFVGRWYDVPEEGRTCLGRETVRLRGAGVLGQSALVGARVWQRDLRMRVVLGPLNRRRFQSFLPGASGALALREWLTLFTGVSLEYEINLQLAKNEVQGASLTSERLPMQGCLGWDTFLLTAGAQSDRMDVRYDIHLA
ncbi:MAG: type VI secretion system baseplate subunit TssG [Aquabacterium sp.]|uniref:type VI secretion system baseplate subunit TssG n=1 Tax=Aquabacterium sp. TaxID=1872578 RepID=UPI003BDF1CDA